MNATANDGSDIEMEAQLLAREALVEARAQQILAELAGE